MTLHKMTKKAEIHAFWDEEAKVWYAESEDIPGLVTEAATQQELLLKIKAIIPDLLELNGMKTPLPALELVSHQSLGQLSS